MIWEELKKGIYIEEDNVLIEWGTSVRLLQKIASPEVLEQNGRTEIIWHDKTILKNLKGDWRFSFFPYEMFKSFDKISLFAIGDKQATEAYDKYKNILSNEIGEPSMSNEMQNGDKQLKWENKSHSIFLYLFEMHSLRCSLTISKK